MYVIEKLVADRELDHSLVTKNIWEEVEKQFSGWRFPYSEALQSDQVLCLSPCVAFSEWCAFAQGL